MITHKVFTHYTSTTHQYIIHFVRRHSCGAGHGRSNGKLGTDPYGYEGGHV